jgi:predicted amidohydrolase
MDGEAQDRLRIALWQGPSPQGETGVALATLRGALKAAAAVGAQVLVAPELFLPGYNHSGIAALAQPRGGAWHVALAEMTRAEGCALVLGYAEREGTTLCNAAVVFDAHGREVAHYRKIQLYGPREAALFAPGANYTMFTLAGQSMAVLICYDVEFAPHVAALAARGARVILVPTANMLPFTHVADATVPAMAANHGVAIAYANLCGEEGDLAYAGGSVIAGPHGEVLAKAGPTPALLVADLPAPDPARLSTQARDFRPIA